MDRETPVAVEPSDFDAFFRAQYRSVTGLAYVLCGDRGRAEDLAQDAFADAHRAWPKISRYDEPATWIRRVVTNKAISLRRKRSAESRAIVRLVGRPPATETDSAGLDASAVWSAVRALPRRQAQVVALVFLDDLDVAEVARILECGEATVKTHLHRAKAALALRFGLDPEEGLA